MLSLPEVHSCITPQGQRVTVTVVFAFWVGGWIIPRRPSLDAGLHSVCNLPQCTSNQPNPMPHNCYFWLLWLSEGHIGASQDNQQTGRATYQRHPSLPNLEGGTTQGRALWASFRLITSRKGKKLLSQESALARWAVLAGTAVESI